MAFYKTAQAPILGVYQSSNRFSKRASQNADITEQEEATVKHVLNIISKDVLKAISKVYKISDNIDDYIFPVPRAVTADVPNNNGDNFSDGELIRFSDNHRCLVFQTFRNDPLHIEHVAHDPKVARGYVPDAYYLVQDPNDKYVLTVVAMDVTKDPPLAEGLLSGEIDNFSMGCICEAVQCSYSPCRKIARSDKELCEHLLFYKMATIDGELIFEDCQGVEYQELSVVGLGADAKARTQAILKYASKKAAIGQVKQSFNIISSLVSDGDAYEVARYFNANAGKLPEAMLRLGDKLF